MNFQQQSWNNNNAPVLIPLGQVNTDFHPGLVQTVWNGTSPKRIKTSFAGISGNSNLGSILNYYGRKQKLEQLLTAFQSETGRSWADTIVIVGWCAGQKDNCFPQMLKHFGLTDSVPTTLVGGFPWSLSAISAKAMEWFTHTPLGEIPGFGVGILEGFGDDIKGLYHLASHLTHIIKANAKFWDKDAFEDEDYIAAVNFFSKLKDGAQALMTQEGFSKAVGSWYGKLKTDLTTSWQEGNFYQHGKVLGKVTYRVVTSVYAVKGVVTAISSLQKTVVSALKKQILGTASSFKKVVGKKPVCTGLTCTKPGQCFVAGTPVWTQNGTKAIENIKVGDIVLSRDDENNQTIFKPVTKVFVRTAPKVLNLTLAQGEKSETIGTTPEHPFYVVGRGFVSAGKLVPGMVIRQVSSDVKHQLLSEVSMNALLTVQKLDYGNTPTKVYNFEVADTHTYVVGASQALVHNRCGFRFSEFITRTVKESHFIKNVVSSFANSKVFTRVKRFKDSIVILRADIPLSHQNLRRMVVRNAPFVRYANGWQKLHLHHIGRKNGKVIEVMQNMHYYQGPLHIPGPGARVKTPGFTAAHWMARFDDLLQAGKISRGQLEHLVAQLKRFNKTAKADKKYPAYKLKILEDKIRKMN